MKMNFKNIKWNKEYADTYNKLYGGVEMDMTQYAVSESKDLKAKDFVGKNIKVKISGVSIRKYDATDDKAAHSRPALSFAGKEKELVLNATNTDVLCVAYGNDSEGWVGHEIGLTVADYTVKGFGHGWVVTPLDVVAPDFESDIAF